MFKIKFLPLLLLIFSFTVGIKSQTKTSVILTDGLVVRLPRNNENDVITPDPVTAQVVTGKWKAPALNDKVVSNGKVVGTWKKIKADDSGWFRHDSLNNAYIYFRFNSDKDQIAVLEGMGHTKVYVNGIERSGNPYRDRDNFDPWGPRFDYSLLPVKLHKGSNDFLFQCRRGYFKAIVHTGEKGLMVDDKDLTVPDIILNKKTDTYGAVPFINATENFYKGLYIKTWAGNSTPVYYPVNQINPLSVYKIAFRIKLPVVKDTGTVKLNLRLVKRSGNSGSGDEVLSSASIPLSAVKASTNHKETFISKIDGSVQYYAVNPPDKKLSKPALFLSLHGAGVEAINQANAYYHKDWGYIVCPTNRRPYGYDWENWGRMDALEVLNIAKKEFDVNKSRVYLTGHSMGGHGVWQLGINYPDLFGAIGPSAGWISYWSYRIHSLKDSTPVTRMLVRSTKQSDTYAFTTNLKPDGIYIIQGSADDNVPPEQAESMVKNLSKFHKDFIYYVEPGAGHWWDVSDEPGADCVDWAPLFDFFAHHAVASNDMVDNIDFTTANPAISSKDYWAQIINQVHQQKLSRVKISLEPGKREFIARTSNIETLAIDASMLPPGRSVTVVIDGQIMPELNLPADNKILLRKSDGNWNQINGISTTDKYPGRCGNFREAFNHDVMFVYGSHGTKAENKWALDKVRVDAERIWYRGNGAIKIIKDDDFSPEKYKDRSVILFGNSETNSAWNKLLKNSPVQVKDGRITVGNKEYRADDYACLMIRPRKDSKVASVGVVAGTGIKGMNLADLAPYFNQYESLPDIVIFNSDIIKSDTKGVKLTGYFGNDWSLDKGEFAK